MSVVGYRAGRHDDDAEAAAPDGAGGPPRWSTTEERWAAVELNIQMAIRRGEFEDLPGAGKPIAGLDRAQDPDWWICQKIESEDLSGIVPPVFQLRNEDVGMHATLDEFARESDVREYLDGFNARVRAARLQLTGGPPVVTRLRDVDAEVKAWAERREAARVACLAASVSDDVEPRKWWRRRRSL